MDKRYFQTPVERRGSYCAKWDTMARIYGRDDLIHLGVADMDWRSAPEIIDYLRRVSEAGVFGYSDLEEDFYESIIDWYRQRHGLEVARDWIVFVPRITTSSHFCVHLFTEVNEACLVNSPMYSPLQDSILLNGRRLVKSPLRPDAEGRFRIDFADMGRGSCARMCVTSSSATRTIRRPAPSRARSCWHSASSPSATTSSSSATRSTATSCAAGSATSRCSA